MFPVITHIVAVEILNVETFVGVDNFHFGDMAWAVACRDDISGSGNAWLPAFCRTSRNDGPGHIVEIDVAGMHGIAGLDIQNIGSPATSGESESPASIY